MFCPVDIQLKTNQLRTRAPLRVAVGQLRTTPSRLKNIAYRRVHSPPPGTTPALVVDAFMSAAWPPGGGDSWWASSVAGQVFALELVALAAASSPPAFSEWSKSHVRSCWTTRDLSFRVALLSRLRPVSFKFVIASCSDSLRSRVFGPSALVGSARDGAVCRAAPVAALLGPLA